MIEKPNSTPICCGKPAEWVVLSANLSYFYCRECKNEVFPKKEVLKTDADDWHWNGGFLSLPLTPVLQKLDVQVDTAAPARSAQERLEALYRCIAEQRTVMSVPRVPVLEEPKAQTQYGLGGKGYIKVIKYFK